MYPVKGVGVDTAETVLHPEGDQFWKQFKKKKKKKEEKSVSDHSES